ncbi:hypothetical protein [Lactonifactor longoviformis]|uniref:hypothetical protein n=1 Tax=Lactonifactor longoviformis TaxID=341220 RepID=UPI001D016A8C|nr:hypothetical protein [Lactonifactor longoviformis]MCB5713108.1 hypothetical protein [Lactonifactor longoviformis]MCB5717324.1 hypothetical protein [Lactonifactor longoviformis]
MKKRILTGILCLTAAAFLVVGCQSDSSGDSAKDTSQESESILGQVTAIEDGTITLALGERSENEKMQPPANKEDDGGTWEAPPDGEDGGTPPDTENGGTPPGGEDGGTPPDAENGGTPPGGEDGGTPPDSGNGLPGGLELTGEETTIAADDSVSIVLDTRGETSEGSLDDISVGSILTVEMNGGKAVSITVTVLDGGSFTPPV